MFSAVRSTVAGVVYTDWNNDGVQGADETGIAGVSVRLTGTSAAGATINTTVTTDVFGTYVFQDVPAANPTGYTITETQPSAYNDGKDTLGAAGGADGSAAVNDRFTGIGHDLTIPSADYNFGELPIPAMTFAKTVYAGTDSGASCPVVQPEGAP